jgi:ParB family transcriptional regulator, chromosome partitioning protein
MVVVENELQIKTVLLQNVRVNPHQPRRHFSQDDLEGLAESIEEVGLIHPPLVRPVEDEEGIYELISGERRYRACQLTGLKTIPVIIRTSSELMSAQQALVENIQRVDLNPLEIAKALKSLVDDFGLNQEGLAQRVGKNRSTVANYLRLLSLPRGIQESIDSGRISMGHAKAILSMTGFERQGLLHDLILRDDLTVREAEQAAQRIHQKGKKKKLVHANRDFVLEQLSERIQQRLGTKVNIVGKGKKGRICIDYYNLDDLDRLLAIFGVDDL